MLGAPCAKLLCNFRNCDLHDTVHKSTSKFVGVTGFHAREKQKVPVRAIVEKDLFRSARSSFFFLLSFFSHPGSCLENKIVVGTAMFSRGAPREAPGQGGGEKKRNEKKKKTEKMKNGKIDK